MDRYSFLKCKKEDMEAIDKIADRAKQMSGFKFDRQSLEMDLLFFNDKIGLRLEDLLKSEDMDFLHDIIGMQNHIDRRNLSIIGMFVPRYSK